MTKEKLTLLDVLRGFIQEEKLNIGSEPDWQELVRLSRINSVSGILGYMAMQSPDGIDANLAAALKRECLQSLAVYARRTKKAEELFSFLGTAGIDHVLIKGYVVRELYPVPELRSYNDIDILIKPEDRKKCHEIMLSQGFSVKEDWEPVYSYYKHGELYEIHTEVLEPGMPNIADLKSFFSNIWQHTEKLGEYTFKLKDELHFIYLLTHIAKHVHGSGAGIRMYLDLAAFVKRLGNAVDWQYVESSLGALGLRKLANMALTVCGKYFGVQSPIELSEIDDEALESFMDYTMDGGTFGHVGRDGGLIALKQAGDKSRTETVLRSIFPSADTIERRYTYLRGRHWLLPAAWVHRVIKNRGLMGRRIDNVKSIIRTDGEEAEKLRKICEDVGL